MSNLSLMACPACDRHVRVGEPACPFCRAPLEGVAPPARRRARGRLTRFALVAGVALAGSACGPSSVPDDSIREQETNGDEAPPPEEDEPPPEEVAPEDGDEQAEDDVGEPVTLYGGPSIEMLV